MTSRAGSEGNPSYPVYAPGPVVSSSGSWKTQKTGQVRSSEDGEEWLSFPDRTRLVFSHAHELKYVFDSASFARLWAAAGEPFIASDFGGVTPSARPGRKLGLKLGQPIRYEEEKREGGRLTAAGQSRQRSRTPNEPPPRQVGVLQHGPRTQWLRSESDGCRISLKNKDFKHRPPNAKKINSDTCGAKLAVAILDSRFFPFDAQNVLFARTGSPSVPREHWQSQWHPAITVRNGNCCLCYNCGSSMGCS
jgi:hypothetical protein